VLVLFLEGEISNAKAQREEGHDGVCWRLWRTDCVENAKRRKLTRIFRIDRIGFLVFRRLLEALAI